MASSANSIKDYNVVSGVFTGVWEDIKDYTSAIVTIARSTTSGAGSKIAIVRLEWAHTAGRTLPSEDTISNTDIVATESFDYTLSSTTALTRQYDHRARWFRLRVTYSEAGQTGTIDLQTLYKRAPTELKIVDDQANVVSVMQGERQTPFTLS
jgi:hypothetical protein